MKAASESRVRVLDSHKDEILNRNLGAVEALWRSDEEARLVHAEAV